MFIQSLKEQRKIFNNILTSSFIAILLSAYSDEQITSLCHPSFHYFIKSSDLIYTVILMIESFSAVLLSSYKAEHITSLCHPHFFISFFLFSKLSELICTVILVIEYLKVKEK